MGTNVRVVPAGSGTNLRTVNILTSLSGIAPNAVRTKSQITAAQSAAQPDVFETVMPTPHFIPGLPSVFISGYTGPL
jgi:hypothetical protein